MSKPIHILFTIPNFDTAGSGKVVYDLVQHIDTSRFKVSIACNHDKGPFFKKVAAFGVPIHILDITVPLRPYFSLLQRLKPYRNLLQQEQIDLVHSWHWQSDWTEPLACRMEGVPFVYTKKSMGWGHKHWYIRSCLSNFIITVNSDMQRFFPKRKRQALIPFGLDLNHYNPDLFDVPKRSTVFQMITVANLVAVKNIEYLVEAVEVLKHLPIHLQVIGDTREGYAQSLQAKVIDLKLDKHIEFVGKQADIRPWLHASDLYVIPSKQEGMPMALVEAMAMGVPVLGANVPGIRYVLKDFKSLLFKLDTIDSLVSKIRVMYDTPIDNRKELGAQLRAYCLEHYGMDAFIKAHEYLYLEQVK